MFACLVVVAAVVAYLLSSTMGPATCEFKKEYLMYGFINIVYMNNFTCKV